MAELKVVIAGSGLIAKKKHIPAWKKQAGEGRLVALCDVNADAAKAACEQFGIDKSYSNFTEMLATEKPDIVDICTPPRTHVGLALEAMAAGANVMIEKPMAMSVEECDQIVDASRRHNVKVCCAHSDLFYLSMVNARRLLSEGVIGEFRGMHIFLSTPVHYITSKPDHWAHKLPGGVIGETGPHVVYMTLPFINPIEEIGVTARKILPEFPWSPFEDYRIELAGAKAISSVILTYTNTEWYARVKLFGTNGIIMADLETQTLVVYKRKNLKASTAGMSLFSEAMQMLKSGMATGTRYAMGRVQSTHQVLVSEFIAAIKGNQPSPVPPEDGRETVRVLGQIVQQLSSKYATSAAAKA